MRRTQIQQARVALPDGQLKPSVVTFDQTIRSVGGLDRQLAADARIIQARDAVLSPGLIDLHTHGICQYAFERSPEDLRAGLEALPRFGVTTVLPTLYRVLRPESFPLLEQLAAALDQPAGARAPGFHLEGPFLAIAGAGALMLDADVKFLDELIAACRGRVTAMSISPEVAGIIPVIERLRERQITPFITHTRASAEQTQAAIDAGARHATHFYDVFPLPPETEPGVRPVGAVEALLADPRATVDFIADGVHVHPVAIRAALAAKGPGGVIAISDANVGAGLPPGTYETPWGYRVSIKAGDAARIADVGHPAYGGLAGSGLTMNRAVANLAKWLPDADAAWNCATRNPAAVVGLQDRGAIQSALAADLVLWNADHTPRHVWIGGECIYSSETSNPPGT